MLLRLDAILTERNLVRSRRVARSLIKDGKVKVNGEVIKKQGKRFDSNIEVVITDLPKYVSRAGYKLEHALKEFNVSPKDKVALDVGASTGGFTDCLLQAGAKKVYAIEVGTAQLADELREDTRIVSMEDTDIRDIKKIPETIDLAVIDVSFISLTLVIPQVTKLISPGADIIALIKPQFEVHKSYRKGGVIKNADLHAEAVKKIRSYASETGLKVLKTTESPIKGSAGNQEFLIHLKTV